MDDTTQQNKQSFPSDNNTQPGPSNAPQTANNPLLSFATSQSVNEQSSASGSQISASANTDVTAPTAGPTPSASLSSPSESEPAAQTAPAAHQGASQSPSPAAATSAPASSDMGNYQSRPSSNQPTLTSQPSTTDQQKREQSSPADTTTPAQSHPSTNWQANQEKLTTLTDQPAPTQASDEKLFAIGEAARYLNVSIDTIRRWDSKGILHAVRSEGNLRRFSKAELDRCKAEQQKEDNMLTVSEAADLLKVSIQTMRRWDKSGKLRAQRDNQGQRLYPKAEIEEMIRTGSIPFMQESEDSADNNKQENRPTPSPTTSPVNTPGVYSGKTDANINEQQAKLDNRSVLNARPQIESLPSQPKSLVMPAPKAEETKPVETTAGGQNQTPIATPLVKQNDILDFEDLEELEQPQLGEKLRSEQQPKPQPKHEEPRRHEQASHHDHPYAAKDHEHPHHDKLDKRYAETQHEHKHEHPEASHHTVRSRKYITRIKTREPHITPAEYNSVGEFIKPQITDHGVDSTGTSVLPAGETKVVVKTQSVSNRSHIFVTPITPTEVPLSVPVAISNEGFAVVTVKPQPYDIIFTWFIVDTHLED